MLPWFSLLTLVGRLLVETGSPDALCPDLASAEAAIRARLGELEAGGSANWRLRYTIGHAPAATSGDFVRLELYDPQGQLRLSRDIPLAGESCATVARVMALVVDRFFRAMVAEQANEAGATPSAERDAASDAGFDNAARARARPANSLTVQAGILASPFSPTLGLAFTRRTQERFSLSFGLTWVVSPATQALQADAQAESRSALVRLSPTWDIGLESVELALGPTLALGGESGTTTGLPKSDVKYRAVAALGALACLSFLLDENLSFNLSGGVEAPFRPFGGEFVVGGERVLEPADVRGFFAIGVGPAW